MSVKCSNCEADTFTCGGCGVVIKPYELAESAPRPVIDRERVAEVLASELPTGYQFEAPIMADALIAAGVARPMPTREQIERALRDRLQQSNFADNLHEPIRTQSIDQWVDLFAGTVLTLLNGSEVPSDQPS